MLNFEEVWRQCLSTIFIQNIFPEFWFWSWNEWVRESFNNFGQENDDLFATMLSIMALKFTVVTMKLGMIYEGGDFFFDQEYKWGCLVTKDIPWVNVKGWCSVCFHVMFSTWNWGPSSNSFWVKSRGFDTNCKKYVMWSEKTHHMV